MKKEEMDHSKGKRSRRDVLKKAGLFVAPTIASFNLSELTVAASGTQKFSDWADKPKIP